MANTEASQIDIELKFNQLGRVMLNGQDLSGSIHRVALDMQAGKLAAVTLYARTQVIHIHGVVGDIEIEPTSSSAIVFNDCHASSP